MLVTLAGAVPATLTVSVIGRIARPAASTSLRVQVRAGCVQVQPVPAIAVAVNPAGSVSVTVTVPLVGAVPLLRHRQRVGRPGLSLRERPGVRLRHRQVRHAGSARSLSRSLAVLLAVLVSPPPLTVAVFVTLAGAVLATLTVSVIAG